MAKFTVPLCDFVNVITVLSSMVIATNSGMYSYRMRLYILPVEAGSGTLLAFAFEHPTTFLNFVNSLPRPNARLPFVVSKASSSYALGASVFSDCTEEFNCLRARVFA